MTRKDYEKIANTFKKYEVKGEGASIRGKRTYGFDRSRIDGKLIRRRRAN